jgi:hypothetical protein
MIEALCDIGGDGRLHHHLRPTEQKIVIVEHVLALLCLHIRCKELAEFSFPRHAPWKGRAQHILQWALGIHDTRINRQAGTFYWEPLFRLREAKVVPDKIQEIGRVFPIMNCE